MKTLEFRTLKNILWIVSISAYMSACSNLQKIAFSHGEFLLYQYIDGKFDLSEEQGVFLKKRLSTHYDWFKIEQLPTLQSDLRNLGERWADPGLDSKDIQWLQNRWRWHTEFLLNRILDDTTQLFLLFKEEQWLSLAESMTESNEKFEDLLEDEDNEFEESRKEQLEENLEKWYEEVNTEQLLIAMTFFGDRNNVAWYLKLRKKTQHEFLERMRSITKSPQNAKEIRNYIYRTIMNPIDSKPKEERERYKEYVNRWKDALPKIDALASTQQREFARNKLKKLSEDLNSL